MGFFSGGKSWQTSDSYSGLRGTEYFKPHASGVASDYRFGADAIKGRLNDFNPLGLTGNGLTTAQNSAFKTLGEQLFSNVSGSYAGRGFLSPENVSGVIGSSLTQAAPTLMDQVYKNQMGNESIMSDRFTQLLNLLGQGTGLVGSEAHSAGNMTSGNLLGASLAKSIGDLTTQAGSALIKGASAGALCWIAEALYGKLDLRTHLARFYVNTILPLSEEGRIFRAWYAEHGEKLAAEIPGSPALRQILQPLFDSFVYRAALHLA